MYSNTLVTFYQSTWRHIPEDNLHIHFGGSLKSHRYVPLSDKLIQLSIADSHTPIYR
jgi:hypothetical protein